MQQAAQAVPEDSLGLDELHAAMARGLRATMFGRPIAEVIALGAMVAVARLVSPSEYGRFAIAMFVTSMSVLPLSGLGVALVQRRELRREHIEAGVAIAVIMGAGLVVLSLLVARLVILPVFGSRVALLVEVNSGVTILAALNAVPAALVQRRLEVRRLAVIDVSNAVSIAAVSVALAAIGMEAMALVLGAIAGWLMTLVQNTIWAGGHRPRLHREQMRELIRFTAVQAGISVSWVGFANIDYAIVGARLGPRETGFYTRAYTVGVIYQTKVSQVLSSVGFPLLARTRNREEMDLLYPKMARLLTLVMFPCLTLLGVLAPVLIPWVFGQRWEPAVQPTQILVIGGAATLVIDAAGAVLLAAGRQRALLAFGWAHFLTYGSAVLVGTRFGIVGVATAAAIDHVVFMLVVYAIMFWGTSHFWLGRLGRDLGPGLLGSAGLACAAVPVSALLRSVEMPVVPFVSIVACVSLCAYLCSLAIFSRESLRMLRRFSARLLPRRAESSPAEESAQAPVSA